MYIDDIELETEIGNISCCGKDCYGCIHFPHDCLGCNAVKGRVFWLEYVDEVICPIFNCCKNKNEYIDCGLCAGHPCLRYTDGETEKCEPIPVTANSGAAALKEYHQDYVFQVIEATWTDVKVS